MGNMESSRQELNFVKANWVSRLNNRIEMYFSWREMKGMTKQKTDLCREETIV